ncbi:hypothetical protein TBLA_0C04120 [Henningerozyma blattae CBS 6284]|uniref:Importin N-terminal domain-containing protein n=1 Tax=Henningerozyma blattae (strain ATCC 34711 / CBS 6284 / DSM 70876 / NBRC 10599 / NRRL Y-10934 / UCD 77-7) TaxID=1071380 RepID=I2H1G0_HENB6|nr:hypothetical protein TBLA_0C04120 [Tetrapisispora blattae CBS 6284]CCH60212.1 hypothetical protein TBLA_0C04120 [Tetrapisispora blattae CBS 6284]
MDIQEVVGLVNTLSGAPTTRSNNTTDLDIVRVQQHFQKIQTSEHGFDIANQLLNLDPNQFPNCGYFGALTLTVQLNTNVHSIDQLWKLFFANISHLVRLSHNYITTNSRRSSSSWNTIKKLMSNSSLIFTNLNNDANQVSDDINNNLPNFWNNPIDTLIFLLSSFNDPSSGVSVESWSNLNDPNLNQLILQSINNKISYDQLINFIQQSKHFNKLILTFTEIIVEDITKFQSKKNSISQIYEIVHNHLYITTMTILNFNLSNFNIINTDLNDLLFQSISAWINYISMARTVSPHGKMDLNEIFLNLIHLMSSITDNYTTTQKIVSIFANVFANDALLLDFDIRYQFEVIFLGVSRTQPPPDVSLDDLTNKNQWMMQYMKHMVTNEMYDDLRELSNCIVDFLQINTLDVCNKLFTTLGNNNSSNSQEHIKILLQLTNFPLTPVLQEYFSVKMVDFWMDLAEGYTNLPQESMNENSADVAIEIFQQVLNIYLPKISLLNKQKLLEDTDEDNEINAFDDFRTAVSELIESFWAVLGNSRLTNVLIEGISQNSTSNPDIFQIETMAFLLNILLVDMDLSDSPWICDIIGSNSKSFFDNILFLFQTGHTNIIMANQVNKLLQTNFVKTSTILIGTLAGYYETDVAQLSMTIDKLFQGLEVCAISTNDQGIKDLNDKLETFIINTIAKLCEDCKKQLTGYLNQFINVLNSILDLNSNMSNFTREKMMRSIGYILQVLVSNGPQEQANFVLALITNTIQLIEKTMANSNIQQVQVQINYIHCLCSCISELGSSFIQKNEMEDSLMLPRLQEFQTFWAEDPLQIRAKVLNILDKLLSNPLYGKRPEFVEISCLILGKASTIPEDEPHFLRFSMPEIMEFLIKHLSTSELSVSLPYFVYLLERLVCQFKALLTVQEYDFMFERFFLAFYQDIIAKDPDLVQMTVNFVNNTLDVKPSLAIHSTHWTTFILPEFLKLLSSKEKFTLVATTKFWTKMINNKKYTQQDLETVQQQINALGQNITLQVMYGVFHTQRSDINAFTDVIRALIGKYPMQTKNWLIDVLPQVCHNPTANDLFIKKLSVARGSRASGNVILEWWLTCNALPSL